MESKILKQCPMKIDIGAVFSAKPIEKKGIESSSFKPLEKELCFDIDLTDYDEIRTCCQDKTICEKCWAFIVISVKIIDCALREDFGFNNILWVYSGRRGIHCWVCDDRARKLNQAQRKAIVSYLELIKGGIETKKRVNFTQESLHPFVTRSFEIASNYVQDIINDQNICGQDSFLSIITDEYLKTFLSKLYPNSSLNIWRSLMLEIDQLIKLNPTRYYRHLKEELTLQFTYPRLDSNVSIQLNHLLKSPFCIHPSTGRVCVPVNPDDIESFNPMEVPTVQQLCSELESFDSSDCSNLADYKKTSLKPYVIFFQQFLDSFEKAKIDDVDMAF